MSQRIVTVARIVLPIALLAAAALAVQAGIRWH